MYRPNFCSQCGERILREKWRLWTSRRYCDACAKVLQKPQLVAPFLGSLILICVGVIAGTKLRPEQPAMLERNSLVTLTSTPNAQTNKPQANTNAQTNISATPQINVQQTPLESEQPAYYCGARTQKGTPCMRRVRGATRCWQHEGKPPMMAQEKLLISDK